MNKKSTVGIGAILIIVLLVSIFFTPIGVILENFIFSTPSYELKPEELYEEWTFKPNPEWYGDTSASSMGDNSDVTIARLHGSYDFPIQWGSLNYTVPPSSGLYQGTPLSVTVYVRAIEAVGRETSTITPTLDFPDQSLEGPTFNVPYQGYTTFSHEFNCEGKTWEDIDNMIIGAIARPNSQNGEWVYISEIWTIVKYDDTPPPSPPDISITYTMTVLTSPNNCDVNILGVEIINSGDNGIAMFEDIPYGSHTIMVSKTGYPTVTKTVLIDSDAALSMDLTPQKYLIPILFLISVGAIVGIIIYCYKKKKF